MIYALTLLFFFIPGVVAYALELSVDNYLYAHTDQTGSTLLGDKYGNTTFHGDAFEHDAEILALSFRAMDGISGERLYIKYPDGSTQDIAVADPFVTLNKTTKSIQIVLEKTTNQESYVEVSTVTVDDASAPEIAVWTFNQDPPSSYGNLPGGSNGGGEDPDVLLIPVSYWYQPTNDEYRISYREPSGISKYELHFTASSGMVYTAEYDFAPTGIHYLTCNGVYYLKFYDSSGKLVAKTKEVTTHRIEAPACRSYTEQESVGRDELNTNVDAENNISWDSPSGAETIEIWKEGEKVGEQDASDSTYENAGPGGYTIIAKDSNGNVLGQSDLNVVDSTGENPNELPGTDCGTCEKLDQLLACPGWDIAMGDLTGAIQDALPPPPNWDEIADKIGAATVDHLADYLGEVPTPPSKEEIEQATQTPMPDVDTSVPEVEQLEPEVPDEYNDGQIIFELDNEPGIEVKPDDSDGFDITEPLSNMDYDEPGKAVIPGDENNNSGGIDHPEQVDTGEAPEPGQIIFELPRPGSAPSPNPTTSTPPIPNTEGGPGAVPGTSEGIVPIPDIN
ncbi:hypothetical protein [Paenibacillus sp. 453mf]|uniref:hypothetical protein n=1 Tax=Paenibacillus sp. 453mf TaxID=1761874 RepID=UPI0011140959|nr:hypothetical protein [Paenibacillus sp. 453mf]